MGTRPRKRRANTPGMAAPRADAAATSAGHHRALTLSADSRDAVRAAREMVRGSLQDWGLGRISDDARLVVSELVSNVVQHAVPDNCLAQPGARRRIDVSVMTWPGLLCIGVTDEDSAPPDLPVGDRLSPELVGDFPEALLPERGRGLMIVQRLADSVWWSPEEPGGKTVWCRFDTDEHA
ncbi:ATP-binding protein [Streptomyces spectabilis]|uniref:ATP-binding protein n=2 Tax=Streptomyces spectabilis TaxID=68270 RepID=A0A516R6P9_STRST|nr:ATP-binding protein [Streptomyces spectabilis]